METEEDRIVFIKGLTVDITDIDPKRITQRIEEIINGMENIRKVRDSLKVTCRTIEDKNKLKGVTTILGHTVIITEPYKKKRFTATNNKTRGIIFGVNKDI